MTFQDTGVDQRGFAPPSPQRMADAADTGLPDQPTAPAPTPSTPSPQAAPAQPQGDAAQFLRELEPSAVSAQPPAMRPEGPPPQPPAPLDRQWPPPFQRRPATFYPSMANRPPSEWGKDHFTLTGGRNFPGVAPGPFMPQPWELPGIYQGLGNQLSRWGSGYVGPMAGMMGRFSGAWMKGFAQGQMMRARLLHQQMRQAADETDRRLQQELDEYGPLFAIYKDKPDQLREALRQVAEKYQDRNMQAALDQGGTAAAERLLQWYDGKHSDLKKSNAQAAKDERERALDEPHRKTPIDDAGTPIPTPKEPGPAPAEEQRPETPDTHPGTNEPLPTEQPGLDTPDAALEEQEPQRQQLAMAGDQLPTQEPSLQSRVPARRVAETVPQRQSPTLQRADQEGYKWQDVNGDASRAFQNGGISATDAKGMSARYRGYVEARRLEIGRELEEVMRSNARGNEVYAAVNARVPGFGDQIKGYVEGRFPLPTRANWPMRSWVQNLGSKADPTWNSSNYATRAAAIKSFGTQQDGRLITGIATGNDHVGTTLGMIDELERSGQITNLPIIGGGGGTFLNSLYQKYITQAPANAPGVNAAGRQIVNRFNYEIDLVAPEIARAQRGANPTLSEIKEVKDKLSSATNADDLRAMLLDARHLFIQRAHEHGERFRALVGRDPVRGIGELIDNIERKGVPTYEPPTRGENIPLPSPSGGSYGNAYRQLLQERDPGSYGIWVGGGSRPPVPGAPAAPRAAPAAPGALPPGWNIRER